MGAHVVGCCGTPRPCELLLFSAGAEAGDNRDALATRLQFVILGRQPNAPHSVTTDLPSVRELAVGGVGDEFMLVGDAYQLGTGRPYAVTPPPAIPAKAM